jgi:hypothetical protein
MATQSLNNVLIRVRGCFFSENLLNKIYLDTMNIQKDIQPPDAFRVVSDSEGHGTCSL